MSERYVVLLRNEGSASGWMLVSGSDYRSAHGTAINALGGRLLDAWATTGRFDQVTICEFPDHAAALAYSLAATAAGQYAELLRAYDEGELNMARDLAAKAFPFGSPPETSA
jgi:uncharacterized protein with GYD domain